MRVVPKGVVTGLSFCVCVLGHGLQGAHRHSRSKSVGLEPCQALSHQMEGVVSGVAREWKMPRAAATDVTLTHSLSF